MGHHICHLADLEILEKQYNTLGVDKFVLRYKKYEAFIGDSEAIRFIEEKIKFVYELQNYKGRTKPRNE
jgi:hypothetical protein